MPLHPELTNASVPLFDEVEVPDELGHARHVYIPGERPLTIYLNKHELVMLMTLGGVPEALVLSYLHNQRLVSSIEDIVSVQVDWEIESAAVSTCAGIANLDEKTTRHTVTTGYGQGAVFGSPMDEIDVIHLPPDTRMTQTTLYRVVDAIRLQQSIYKQVGSMYGYALFDAHSRLLHFIEDVDRHNAVDAIAGRMWLEGMEGGDKIFYTTGCLTSEMIIKSAQMGILFLSSRSGVTQMDHQMTQRINLTLSARCTGRYFLLYTGRDRFVAEPGVAGMVRPHGELLQATGSGRWSARVCPNKTNANHRPPRGFPSQV